MRVPVHEQLRASRRERPLGHRAKAAALVARDVRAARMGAPEGQPGAQIWMDQPERPDRPGVSEHPPQRAVAPVFACAQPVTVLDARSPARELSLPGTQNEVDAD